MIEKLQRTFDIDMTMCLSDFGSSSEIRELGFSICGKRYLTVRARLEATPSCPQVLDAMVYLLRASVNERGSTFGGGSIRVDHLP